ncbi:hydrolase [Neiella marina]|uniref:Hydrolase n=1 Tax=Neiella marina TaxID=508461 RepID=A0A8J2U4B7_9GAMM|nr:hydrolase [Neiella marina]
MTIQWLQQPCQSHAGLVVLVHGLEGSAASDYILGMASALQQQRFAVAIFEFRGCGQAPNTKARAYHSGEITDLQQVLTWLKRQYPLLTIDAVGFSLGGNVLARYLGTHGDNSLIDHAVIISAPLDLAACATQMAHWSARIYQRHLLSSLINKTIAKRHRVDWQSYTLPSDTELLQMNTFWQFDDRVTAPLHGFSDANDYYQQCSGKRYLHRITRPTLIIHAADDPFMNSDVIPKLSELPSNIDYVLSQHGGHVGFIEGSWRKPVYWLEQTVPAWLSRRD